MNARAVSPSLDDSLLRSFVEALPDPCVVIDGAGRVLAVNRAWRELPRRDEAAVAASNPVGIDYLALFQSSTADDGVARALSGYQSRLERTTGALRARVHPPHAAHVSLVPHDRAPVAGARYKRHHLPP